MLRSYTISRAWDVHVLPHVEEEMHCQNAHCWCTPRMECACDQPGCPGCFRFEAVIWVHKLAN